MPTRSHTARATIVLIWLCSALVTALVLALNTGTSSLAQSDVLPVNNAHAIDQATLLQQEPIAAIGVTSNSTTTLEAALDATAENARMNTYGLGLGEANGIYGPGIHTSKRTGKGLELTGVTLVPNRQIDLQQHLELFNPNSFYGQSSKPSLQTQVLETETCTIRFYSKVFAEARYSYTNYDTGSSDVISKAVSSRFPPVDGEFKKIDDPGKGFNKTLPAEASPSNPANASAAGSIQISIDPVDPSTQIVKGQVIISGNSGYGSWTPGFNGVSGPYVESDGRFSMEVYSEKKGKLKMSYNVTKSGNIAWPPPGDCSYNSDYTVATCNGEYEVPSDYDSNYFTIDIVSVLKQGAGTGCSHGEDATCEADYNFNVNGTFQFEFPCGKQPPLNVEVKPKAHETSQNSLEMPVQVTVESNDPTIDLGLRDDVIVELFLNGAKVDEKRIDINTGQQNGKYILDFQAGVENQLVAGDGVADNLRFEAVAKGTGLEDSRSISSTTLDVRPRIQEIKPEFQLRETFFFDTESGLDNLIKVLVEDWNGDISAPAQPPYGTVDFELNNRPRTRLALDWGADWTNDMSNDFNVSNKCRNNRYIFKARNQLGPYEFESVPVEIDVTVFPVPLWLEEAISGSGARPLQPVVRSQFVDYKSRFARPENPRSIVGGFDAPWLGPLASLGVEDLQYLVDVKIPNELNSPGKGKVNAELKLVVGFLDDLVAYELKPTASGEIDMRSDCELGYRFKDGKITAEAETEIVAEIELDKVFPKAKALKKVAKGPLKRVVEVIYKILTFEFKATTSTSIDVFLKEENDFIVYDPASSSEINLSSGYSGSVKLTPIIIQVEGTVGVKRFAIIQFPPDPDYLRDAGAAGFAQLEIKYGLFIEDVGEVNSKPLDLKCVYSCSINGGCKGECPDDSLQSASGTTDNGTWQLIPRTYVNDDYALYSAQPKLRTVALQNDLLATQAITETLIIANVYPYPQPDLSLLDTDTGVIVYVHDDPSKPAGRGAEIYSVHRKNGQWQPPVAITDDARPDLAPYASFDAQGNAIAVWEQVGLSFEITPTLDVAYFQSLDIVSSKWDGTSWSAPAKLTDDSLADHEPMLQRGADGTVVALWRTHDGEDILGTTEHPISLTYAIWDGNQWSLPTAAVTGLHELMNVDLAVHSDDDAIVVYALDMDGDLATTDDHELFYAEFDGSSWASPIRMTDDDVSDDLPQVVFDSDGNRMLVWQRGNDQVWLRNSWDTGDAKPVGGQQSPVDSSLESGPDGDIALVWNQSNVSGSDLVYQVFMANADQWSQAHSLTQDINVEAEPSVAMIARDQLQVVYNQLDTVLEDVTVEGDDGTVYTIEDVPSTGASNLVHMAVSINVLLGDVNNDCSVNILDIMTVAAQWGAEKNDANWNPALDINGDGSITILDIMQVAAQWGASCQADMKAQASLPATQTQEAGVKLEPAAGQWSLENGFYEVTLTATNVHNLGGYEATLKFDPAVVQVAEVVQGEWLGSTGRTATPLGSSIDNKTGTVKFGAFSFGDQPGVAGDVTLAVLRLRTLAEGTTMLTLNDVTVSDVRGLAQTVDVQSSTTVNVSPMANERLYLPAVLH